MFVISSMKRALFGKRSLFPKILEWRREDGPVYTRIVPYSYFTYHVSLLYYVTRVKSI